jgi:hypothetical protein
MHQRAHLTEYRPACARLRACVCDAGEVCAAWCAAKSSRFHSLVNCTRELRAEPVANKGRKHDAIPHLNRTLVVSVRDGRRQCARDELGCVVAEWAIRLDDNTVGLAVRQEAFRVGTHSDMKLDLHRTTHAYQPRWYAQ